MRLLFPRPLSRGFTLIELLIVISIIAILAGLAIPAINLATVSARKTQAAAMISQLRTALVAYKTEYGRWPSSSSGTDAELTPEDAYVLLTADSDKVESLPNTASNPRKIVFMEFSPRDLDDPVSPTKIVDPWRQAYTIKVDSDYDNKITVPDNTKSEGTRRISTGVAIWSPGPKKNNEPNTDQTKFIVSW